MRIGYADPPYLGMCKAYDHAHPDGRCWDEPETHARLIAKLSEEFPDGWALSLSTPSMWTILPMCPPDVRIAAWVKPFASFKPGVNPAYAWEPIIFRGGRQPRSREEQTARDWCAVGITLRRGFTGAKPEAFSFWLFDLMGLTPADDFADLFPGSGAVWSAWNKWRTASPERISGALFEAGA